MGKKKGFTVTFDADDRSAFLKKFVRTKKEKVNLKKKRQAVAKKITRRENRQAKAAQKAEAQDHSDVEERVEEERVEENETQDMLNDTLVSVTTRFR
mmetsp:Transcript_28809/g.51288  ORF Transcript_28809/g.51288 Transcript_28809/m.51288 type:complete len:97 (-) Transcript_28809:3800-4090(-)